MNDPQDPRDTKAAHHNGDGGSTGDGSSGNGDGGAARPVASPLEVLPRLATSMLSCVEAFEGGDTVILTPQDRAGQLRGAVIVTVDPVRARKLESAYRKIMADSPDLAESTGILGTTPTLLEEHAESVRKKALEELEKLITSLVFTAPEDHERKLRQRMISIVNATIHGLLLPANPAAAVDPNIN